MGGSRFSRTLFFLQGHEVRVFSLVLSLLGRHVGKAFLVPLGLNGVWEGRKKKEMLVSKRSLISGTEAVRGLWFFLFSLLFNAETPWGVTKQKGRNAWGAFAAYIA